jgi:glyoxylase-like metal-dependent hydrolase (beta-lactamase superfamily II)
MREGSREPESGEAGGAGHGESAAAVDAGLAALGVTRIPLPVPFPQAGGPVNVYLVEEARGLLLFDVGLGTPEAEAALVEGFRRAGRHFDEVRRIVLSHGHVDHFGAAKFVLEGASSPVEVLVHPADAGKVASRGPPFEVLIPFYRAHLVRLGVPLPVCEEVASELRGGFTLARRLDEVVRLEPGSVLETRHLALEVLHMPGHTPGLCCLYDRRHRLLFSADHLLEKVSPNPIIELGPGGEDGHFRPLVAYLASLERLSALEVDLVLPGHGRPFAGHRRVIDGLLGFYGRRQGRILEILRGGGRSGYEVTRALFPRVGPGDLFLVVSETIANLEVLEARGEVTRSLDDGVYEFALARRVDS